jgi:hypothetical protein
MTDTTQYVLALADKSADRYDFWQAFIDHQAVTSVAEVGVFRGRYAESILDACPSITDYWMIDPWRHLDDWKKPANRGDDVFEEFFRQTMERTAAHEAKRHVLRGKTTEVVDQIPEGSLDFAYIDGDHTLRGIAIDLIRIHSKMRPGGWIGGDDLTPSIWQHGDEFEPSMVFPFAAHFAEAHGHPFYALPFKQFLIDLTGAGFEYHDVAGKYPTTELLQQIRGPRKRRARKRQGGRRTGGGGEHQTSREV